VNSPEGAAQTISTIKKYENGFIYILRYSRDGAAVMYFTHWTFKILYEASEFGPANLYLQ